MTLLAKKSEVPPHPHATNPSEAAASRLSPPTLTTPTCHLPPPSPRPPSTAHHLPQVKIEMADKNGITPWIIAEANGHAKATDGRKFYADAPLYPVYLHVLIVCSERVGVSAKSVKTPSQAARRPDWGSQRHLTILRPLSLDGRSRNHSVWHNLAITAPHSVLLTIAASQVLSAISWARRGRAEMDSSNHSRGSLLSGSRPGTPGSHRGSRGGTPTRGGAAEAGL